MERLNELKKLRRYYLAKAEEAALNNNESESRLFAEKARKIDEEIGNILS